jgi:multidrug efflux system outer membrane protein
VKRLLLLAAFTALGACSLEPHYVRPLAPVPAQFPQGEAYAAQLAGAPAALSYPDVFHDARLQKVIASALANNRDLRLAAANIALARAQYRVDHAELFPQLDATAGASFTGGKGSTPSGGAGGSGASRSDHRYSADLGITAFEIDLFGRLRSQSKASLNRYFATQAGAEATRLTLIGDVATAWLTYGADKSLMQIATETAANAQKSVDLTRARLQGGAAPRSDLRQAETILAEAQADLAGIRASLAQDINGLELLVGAPVDPGLLPQSIEEVVGTLSEVPAGLDSAVLLKRPDVVEAEYQLKAANADIGAARAALFPRISLTALAGFASTALHSLFNDNAFSWSASPSASYAIFQAGAGRAGVDAAHAEDEAALATYEKAIQTAFRETSDALARRGTILDQEKANRAMVAAAEDDYQLSNERYRGGVDPFLQVLDAQRSLYAAQQSLIATELDRATNLVTLYRVLGGDSRMTPGHEGPAPVLKAASTR